MVSWMVDRFGDDDQRARWLPDLPELRAVRLLLSDRTVRVGCGVVEDPRGARRRSLRTQRIQGLHFRRQTSGDLYLVVMVETGDDGPKRDLQSDRRKGYARPQFRRPGKEARLALAADRGRAVPGLPRARGQPPRREGDGFKIAMQGLDGGRLNIAACSIGGARAAMDHARAYMQERRQFGKALAEFQALQFKLADMATELDAARLMVHKGPAMLHGGSRRDDGLRHGQAVCHGRGFRVCDQALQLHGGYGYLRDFPIERILRDVRVHQILEGTNEIMRLVIARRLLDPGSTEAIRFDHRGGRRRRDPEPAAGAERPDAGHDRGLRRPARVAWATDPAIKAVLIEGVGEKAFCAGGDVLAVYHAGQEGGALAADFFRREYTLNRRIKTFPKPYVALLDGITMGGGVGVSIHGDFRVATENLMFAMPETGIGLFPDIGASWFLPRCPGETENLSGPHRGASESRRRLGAGARHPPRSRAAPAGSGRGAVSAAWSDEPPEATVQALLKRFDEPAGPAPLAPHFGLIDRCFAHDAMDRIVDALEADGSAFATETLAALETKSPTSCKVALAQMRRARELSFDDCMIMEYRLSQAFMAGSDFYEGIRALLVDKDKNPAWAPATLSAVTAAAVERHFDSLGARDLAFEDLRPAAAERRRRPRA